MLSRRAPGDTWAVADRDENNVTLVTLDVFEVLQENVLVFTFLQQFIERVVIATLDFEEILDRVSLGTREGGDAKRDIWVCPSVCGDSIGDGFGFDQIVALSAAVIGASDTTEDEAFASAFCDRRRRHDQPAIELSV